MNDHLKKLLELQDIDMAVTRVNSELENLPREIESKKESIRLEQENLEMEKKKLTSVQLARKNKEMELNTQEDKIRKHEQELSAVKSNDAYKALLSEIEAAKTQTGQIEDDILNLMEEFDRTSRVLKETESSSKGIQKALEEEIKECDGRIAKLKAQLEIELRKRSIFLPQLPSDVLSRYDFIRQKKRSMAVVSIKGECCSGCNTNLTQSTLNEVRKGKDMILCDSCSRILYFAESPASPPAAQTVPG